MKSKPLKVGELVFITGDAPCFDGASGTVTELVTGSSGKYTRVEFIMQVSTGNGRFMREALFFPGDVKRENRPWLKRHLKDILRLRAKLLEFSELADELRRR